MDLLGCVSKKVAAGTGNDAHFQARYTILTSWLTYFSWTTSNRSLVYAIFPNEILANVASYLDTRSLLSIRSTCRCFFYLALERRYQIVNTQGMNKSTFGQLCCRLRDPSVSKRVKELRLSFEFMMTQSMFSSMLDSVIGHLTEVTSVTYGRLPRLSCVSSWSTFGSNLKSLTLMTYMSSVDDLALDLLSAPLLAEFHFQSLNEFYSTPPDAMQNVLADFINRHAASLRILELNSDFCAFIEHLVTLPSLERFSLGGEYVLPNSNALNRFLHDNCPNLKECGIWLLKDQLHPHRIEHEWTWLTSPAENLRMKKIELSITDTTMTDSALSWIFQSASTLTYLNISGLTLNTDQLDRLCHGLEHQVLNTLCIRLELLSPFTLRCLALNLCTLDTLRLTYIDVGDDIGHSGKEHFLSHISSAEVELSTWRLSQLDLHQVRSQVRTRCAVGPDASLQSKLSGMIPSLSLSKIPNTFIENSVE